TEPIIDDTPTKISASSQKIWPCPAPMPAGDWNPSPVGNGRLEMSGYEVHPLEGAPPSAAKLRRMKMNAGHMNQYDIMFSFGNAMSGAPIMSGIVKFPKAPAKSGMMTKKIITVACMLKSMLYASGGMR